MPPRPPRESVGLSLARRRVAPRQDAQALAGKAIPVMKNRGLTDLFGEWKGLITVHPSSLLRQPDEAARRAGYEAFVSDLKLARAFVVSYGDRIPIP